MAFKRFGSELESGCGRQLKMPALAPQQQHTGAPEMGILCACGKQWAERAAKEHQEALQKIEGNLKSGPSTDPADLQRCVDIYFHIFL